MKRREKREAAKRLSEAVAACHGGGERFEDAYGALFEAYCMVSGNGAGLIDVGLGGRVGMVRLGATRLRRVEKAARGALAVFEGKELSKSEQAALWMLRITVWGLDRLGEELRGEEDRS